MFGTERYALAIVALLYWMVPPEAAEIELKFMGNVAFWKVSVAPLLAV